MDKGHFYKGVAMIKTKYIILKKLWPATPLNTNTSKFIVMKRDKLFLIHCKSIIEVS